MANVKISQLPSLSTMTGVAQIPVVSEGTTYQITGANLQNYFTGTYGNANVVANLAALGSNPVSTTGNITGGYILGNGSQLTGLPATYGNANVAANLAAFANNPILTTGNISGGNLIGSNLTATRVPYVGTGGALIDNAAMYVDMSNQLLYVGGGGAYIGGTGGFGTVSATSIVGTVVSVSGNITGGNVNTNTLVGTATTIKSTGALNLSATGNVVVNSTYINGVSDPAQAQDVATKNYVDTVAQGLNIHQAANLASTQDLATYTSATVTYDNGTSGVGATLSLVGNTLTTLDGTAIPVDAGTRLLIKNQANAVLNGVYNYTSSSLLTRSTDMDDTAGLAGGDFLFVTSGATQADTGWIQTTDNVVVGTNNVVFSQFSSAGAYTANTAAGLVLNGSIFSAKVDAVTTAFDGGGNIIVKASATLTTPNIGVAIGTSLSATGNITGGNLITAASISAASVSASGNITGGNVLGGANVNATTHTGTTVSVTGNVTGGNINTGAQVVATGNITGGNLRSTSLSLSGNVISALNASSSIAAGTTISAVGNITGGNVTTAGLTSTASLSITGNTATVTSANYSIGYLTIPQVTLSANATAGLTDIGKHFYSTTAGNLQITIPDNANVAFPVGTALSVVVQAGGNVLVVTQPSTTLYLSGNATSGNRVVGSYGMATIMKVASGTWFISGTGVS